MNRAESLTLAVTAIRAEARDVMSFELRHPEGRALPAFSAGAHIELTPPTQPGVSRNVVPVRHYSLCNSPSESDRYLIAVGRATNGRGGSQAMHELLRVGATVQTSAPRNNFVLVGGALHYRFIAGGIGITPIMSMILWCEEHGKSWSLLYCSRSRLNTAFYEVLKVFRGRVRFHFDDESGGVADLGATLGEPAPGEHLYCCGPSALMQAVAALSANRASGSVHFEWFSANPEAAATAAGRTGSFEVVLRQSGKRLTVPADKSILEVLEESSIEVPFSCREGFCRTCETSLRGGEADHRDTVLSQEERQAQRSLMICVSRARTPSLELDL